MSDIYTFGAYLGLFIAGAAAVAVAIFSFSMHRSYKKLSRKVERGKSAEKTASKAHSQLIFCGIFGFWAVAPLMSGVGAVITGNINVVSLTTAIVAVVTLAVAGISSSVYARRFDYVAAARA